MLANVLMNVGDNVVEIMASNASGRTIYSEKTIHFFSDKRMALVIGNSKYSKSPLRNPENDAQAMAQVLKELGFEVMSYTNLSQKEMKQAINRFGEKIAAGGIGLFYFAGHGMQVKGENYLIPVDANIRKEQDVDLESVRLARVMAKMDQAGNRMNIVILDACRDNQFIRSFRSLSGRGLASVSGPSGTFIAFATAPGSVAFDGSGKNGLYTQELIKAIKVPGLRIEDVFKRVRSKVLEQSKGLQTPWENTSLGEGDFYFRR
jgi:uncharacterized caspase-like protein